MEQDFNKRKSLETDNLFSVFPLMISNVLQVLFNMADVAVVGRFLQALLRWELWWSLQQRLLLYLQVF